MKKHFHVYWNYENDDPYQCLHGVFLLKHESVPFERPCFWYERFAIIRGVLLYENQGILAALLKKSRVYELSLSL